MEKDRKRQLKVVEDYGFKDLAHLFKFTEALSGAKFKIRKVGDFIGILYTDGDSGVMEFGFSEIYEEHGYQIELIECSWCDITPEYMASINEVFELPNLYEDGEVVVFEKPCLTDEWDSDKPSQALINMKKDREKRLAQQH